MGSLFSKIFLSFWLAAVLLGAALFGTARLWGGDAIAEGQRQLAAHAAIAAALWREGGADAVTRWLHEEHEERGMRLPMLLVDGNGNTMLPLRHPLPYHIAHWLPRKMAPGDYHIAPGRYVIVARLPETLPPLYFISELGPRRLPLTPIWLRIALAVGVTGLVSLGLAALLTRRLRRLRHAAQALAAGDLAVRVGYRGHDEVAALAQDFDQMADHVRELLETQRRLLRDVSHELRSPLARLRVALELAQRGGDPAKALLRVDKEAGELEQLIADVLSLARLESGQTTLERRPVPLHELVDKVVTDAEFEAQAKNRHVTFSADQAVTLQGDPVLLRSAVENVVRNAVRHTEEGSTVAVTLRMAPDGAVIEVRDHGGGVPQEELSRLFQPFARVGEGRERQRGGYGLGLAITGRAVKSHGGEVSIENHPAGGLIVRMHFPAARLMALPSPTTGE